MTARRDDNPVPLRHAWRGRVVFVIALSLLSAVSLAIGTGHASCGSYVTLRSPGKNAARPAVPQSGFGQMLLADHSDTRRPCSGPTCSDRPLIPPLPAVPPARPPADEASGITAFTL